MSQQQQPYTSPGTYTFALPANLVSTTIQVLVVGGRGVSIGGVTNPAQISALLLATLLPVRVVVGSNAGGGAYGTNGGAGFSGGGGGGSWRFQNGYYPFEGGGGGGSSAVLSLTGTIYLEAGGGDGGGFNYGSDNGGLNHSSFPAGTGGGYASRTAGDGQNTGTGAGSGGAAGGNGGTGNGSAGGAGFGGGTNGNSAVGGGTTSGAGVGSGGVGSGGATGNCYAAAPPNVQNASYGVSGLTPQVVFTYHVADPPAAPTLLSPANNVFIDANGGGVTFQGVYQAPAADAGVLGQVALSLLTGAGPAGYWNGTDFSSSTPVWIIPTTGGGARSNEDFSIVVPPGVISDTGSPTYTWSMACRTAPIPLIGAFATPLHFTAVIPPTATITSPVGTVSTDTPTVSWTNVTPAGTQASYRYVIYTTPQAITGTTPPSGSIYDSGVVASAATSFTVPSGILHSVNQYYGYLQIVNSAGSIPSLWTGGGFLVEIQSANVCTLTAVAGTDPGSGMPAPLLTMHMTGADALSFAWFQGNYGNGFEDIVAGLQSISGGTASIYDLGAPFNTAISYRVAAAGVVAGDQKVTAWSTTVVLAAPGVQSNNWWAVPPVTPEAAVQLSRLPATSSSSSSGVTATQPPMPGSGLTASLAVEEWEQQGIFRGFGRANAIVVHGDLWNPEFDLALYFSTPAAYNAFAAIRQDQSVVLLKSDMEGTIYWVTFGPDFNAGIVRETQRHKAPKRSLVVHCTPTDRYFPLNPFVPTN